jgi:hypothetical protein
MVKIFLGNRAAVLILLIPIISMYFLLNFFTNYYQIQNTTNLGYWGHHIPINEVISQFLAGSLILTNAILINAIFNWNEFLERNSFISSLLYVLLMSFYHSFYALDGQLIAHTFIILVIFQLFHLRQNEDGRRIVFNAGFLAGVAASLHPPLIAFSPFLIVMIWSIRPFVLRETLLTLVGFIIPLIYAGAYLLYTGSGIDLKLLKTSTNYDRQQIDFLVSSALFIILFLLSLLSIQTHTQKSSIRLKKLVRILWWLVLVALLLGSIDYITYDQIERFSLLMIPMAFFLTYSFIHKNLNQVAAGLFYLTAFYSVLKFFIHFLD